MLWFIKLIVSDWKYRIVRLIIYNSFIRKVFVESMAVYNPEYPLISIHIPKCAGTSFYNVLKKWFGRKLLRHYHNEKFNRPPKKHKLTAFLSLFGCRYIWPSSRQVLGRSLCIAQPYFYVGKSFFPLYGYLN